MRPPMAKLLPLFDLIFYATACSADLDFFLGGHGACEGCRTPAKYGEQADQAKKMQCVSDDIASLMFMSYLNGSSLNLRVRQS